MRIESLARQLGARRELQGANPRTHVAASSRLNPIAAALLLVSYVTLEWVSFLHEYQGVPITPWNPGLGVAFAVLVLGGAMYGVFLLLGVVIAEIFVLRTQLDWPVIIAMAVFISASFTGAAEMARRYLHLDPGIAHVRDVLALLASGAFAATLSAVLVSSVLLAANELKAGDLTQAFWPLLVGDIIGIAVMTPLLLRVRLRWQDFPSRAFVALLPELLLLLGVVGLTLWMIVGAATPNSYKYFSLLFLPVVAAGVRHGIDGACVSLSITQLGLVALLRVYGYDAATFTEFQVVMLALTMSGLLVGVVVSERQRAYEAAREADRRLKELQSEAARASRMNMVSGMASALAHEINQPMTAARALARSVQQLLDSPEEKARAHSNLATLVAQIDHAGGVVRRMRDFMRRGQPHFSTLDVGAVLEDALALARPDPAFGKTTIDVNVANPMPTIFGDRIQLQQVVLNLVHNAVESIAEASRADGRIYIRAFPALDKPGVEISVSDNGLGVPPDRQLFEPLTSSKKHGLGLGLSICASIVQAHGGRIWLHSSGEGGAEFRFALPAQHKGDR